MRDDTDTAAKSKADPNPTEAVKTAGQQLLEGLAQSRREYERACADAQAAGLPEPPLEDFGLYEHPAPDAARAADPPQNGVRHRRDRAGGVDRFFSDHQDLPPDDGQPDDRVVMDARPLSASLPKTRPPWCEFYSESWTAGTAGMTAAEAGCYIWICAQIMNKGTVTREAYGLRFRHEEELAGKALKMLEGCGKITIDADGQMHNTKSFEVYRSAVQRMARGRNAAHSRWSNKTKNSGNVRPSNSTNRRR